MSNYKFEYINDNIAETLEENLESDEIDDTYDFDLFEYIKDEKYEISSYLFDFFREQIKNYNLINETVLDENKLDYLMFRKWIETFLEN